MSVACVSCLLTCFPVVVDGALFLLVLFPPIPTVFPSILVLSNNFTKTHEHGHMILCTQLFFFAVYRVSARVYFLARRHARDDESALRVLERVCV